MAWVAWALLASLTVALPGADDAPEAAVRVEAAIPSEVGSDPLAPESSASVEVAGTGAAVSVGGGAAERGSGGAGTRPAASTTAPATVTGAPPTLDGAGGSAWGLGVLLSGAAASLWFAVRGGLAGRAARWLVALPLLGMFSRIQRDRLEDHPVRREVMAALDANPGACVEDVQGLVGRAYGTVRYHLERLERERLVVAHVDGRRRRYWRTDAAGARHRPAASLLLVDTPQRIAAVVRDHPGLNQREVARRLRIQPPVACKYLKRLEAEGLVRGCREGRVRRYHPGDVLSGLAPRPTATA